MTSMYMAPVISLRVVEKKSNATRKNIFLLVGHKVHFIDLYGAKNPFSDSVVEKNVRKTENTFLLAGHKVRFIALYGAKQFNFMISHP